MFYINKKNKYIKYIMMIIINTLIIYKLKLI